MRNKLRFANSDTFHLVAAAVLLLIMALAGSAQAHVILVEPSAVPSTRYNAHFKVGHGCNGAPTTRLSVAIPLGVSAVAGEDKPGWTLEVRHDGGRVVAVTWSGGIAAPDKPETFTVGMTLPSYDGTLVFPATQTCGTVVEEWSEVPVAGEKSKRPAPVLTVAATAPTVTVTISDAWIRALPASVPSGGYFALRNGGDKPVTLTGAESPACGMLMLHKSENNGGMSGMMDMAQVVVPAGGDVRFAPGGYHLMCMDAKPVLKPGAQVPVTLVFADGAKVTASFAVRNAAGK